jgi:6-phosphogluconolactonase
MKGALLACLLAVAGLAPPALAASGDFFVYAGSYTDAPSTAKGIYAWRFSPATGTAAALGLAAETVNPAYVGATPDARFLYAVNWQTATAAKGDTVSAYAIDGKTGALSLLNVVHSGGGLPNEVVVNPSGKFAVVTNYGFHGASAEDNNSALAVLPIEDDGKLGEPNFVDHFKGPALSPRQTSGAHTHGVIFTKDNRFAFVAELGLDRIYSYRVDAAKHTLVPLEPAYINTNAGAGPRRMALNPNGKILYVNHETDSKVSVFAIDNGRLKELQQISTLPPDFTGRNTTAEIQTDRQGRFLYVSNRGDDSIVMYAIDPADGTLAFRERIPALGKSPRNITIDPSGGYLFAANQASDNIVIFRIDAKTGHLAPTGQELKMGQPGSVFFVKAAE